AFVFFAGCLGVVLARTRAQPGAEGVAVVQVPAAQGNRRADGVLSNRVFAWRWFFRRFFVFSFFFFSFTLFFFSFFSFLLFFFFFFRWFGGERSALPHHHAAERSSGEDRAHADFIRARSEVRDRVAARERRARDRPAPRLRRHRRRSPAHAKA